MRPEDVEGFPFDNPKARLKLVSGNWTVIERRYFRREGKPCRVCGTAIELTHIAGRGTRFCPKCQS